MAARAGRAGRAASWAISLGVHLLLLAMLILSPSRRLAAPPTIEIQLTPPPESYSPLQPIPKTEAAPAARASGANAQAQAKRSSTQAIPTPVQPLAVSATQPAAAAAVTAATPSPAQSAPPAPAPAAARAAGSPAPAANGVNQAAVNALRQSFGCSSGMRQILTVKEQAGCEQRAAERGKDLPDRSGDTIPQYKRDYYDAVVAAHNSPNHIPLTDCVIELAPAPTQSKSGPPREAGISISSSDKVICVKLPGAGPKPREPTLKDLGLAR